VHPIAFQIGGFSVYWYGIFAAIGFLTGFHVAGKRAPRAGLTVEAVMNIAPWIIGGAIIGARILYVISYWKQDFADKPLWEIFMIRRSGLVFYGGLVGSCLATILYCRIKDLPLWRMADVISPSIALGHVFGRIGCVMTGCCYGRPTNLPWAIHFPADHWTHGVSVHPTQLYESFLNLCLYLGLAALFKRRRFDGQVFATYLIGYAFVRAFTEMFRGDYQVHYLGGIATPGQTVSIGIFLIGIILWWCLPKPGNTGPQTATA
jgi:phosphatidylglycerol:prolipoprotein diacylglycerol transferase